VNDLEVAAIQRVLKSEAVMREVPGGIKLTFIIVSKRINTRYQTNVIYFESGLFGFMFLAQYYLICAWLFLFVHNPETAIKTNIPASLPLLLLTFQSKSQLQVFDFFKDSFSNLQHQ
jgi:hypothetical protein